MTDNRTFTDSSGSREVEVEELPELISNADGDWHVSMEPEPPSTPANTDNEE